VYEKEPEEEYRWEYDMGHIIFDDNAWLAECIAEDYFDNHDGWESSWPLNIFIWNNRQEFIGVYSVELENKPVFNAVEVKE
jgi:hypothetical protein